MIYGTTYTGGTGANGTIFAVRTNGAGFINLHSFAPLDPANHANSDGYDATLVLSGTTLYGTTA